MVGLDGLLKTAMPVVVFSFFLTAFVPPAHAGYWFRHDDDVKGKIVDKDTRQPIEGVVVMAMWVTQFSRITIEPGENYYDYFETRTGADGEFTIPGKGLNFFRNMPPPKIRIYKFGYPIREIRIRGGGITADYPPGDIEIKRKNGQSIVYYRKWNSSRRMEYVQHYRWIPFVKMARAQVSEDRYRLHTAELAKDYEYLGLRTPQKQIGPPLLIFKEGGVHPATNQPVKPNRAP